MNLAGAVAVVILFIILVYMVGLVRHAREVIAVSRSSMTVLSDASVDDDAKEKALQKSAIRLFSLLVLMLVGTAISLVAPIGVVWLLDLFGIVSLDAVLAILARWDFIVIASLVGVAAYVALERRRP
jgi:hypothetical protein